MTKEEKRTLLQFNDLVINLCNLILIAEAHGHIQVVTMDGERVIARLKATKAIAEDHKRNYE